MTDPERQPPPQPPSVPPPRTRHRRDPGALKVCRPGRRPIPVRAGPVGHCGLSDI